MSDGARDPVMMASGIVGVVGNVLAVAFLVDQPGAYRLAELDRWAEGIAAHPIAASASAIAFTIGLFGLAIWALLLGDHGHGPAARAGGRVVAMGAFANGVGTVTPLVLALQVGSASTAGVARALLGLTLTLDAVFNFTLGVGLLAFAAGARATMPRWLRGLAVIAGLASLPVAGQAIYDPAASLLLVSAPLWLGFVLVTSFRRWSPR